MVCLRVVGGVVLCVCWVGLCVFAVVIRVCLRLLCGCVVCSGLCVGVFRVVCERGGGGWSIGKQGTLVCVPFFPKALPPTFFVVWLRRFPTLPHPVGCSTIGVVGLSFRVRNVAGRFPNTMTTASLVYPLPTPNRRVVCARVLGGLWVGCDSYSGCQQLLVCFPPHCLCWGGLCLVLAD